MNDYRDYPPPTADDTPPPDEWESPFEKDEAPPDEADGERPKAYRGATSDPTFGFIIAGALAVGQIPLIQNGQADLRYAVIWVVMAGFGVLAYLLGNSARIWTETPENLGWGIVFGLILGLPLYIVGSGILQETAQRLFGSMGIGSTLAFLVIVIPLSETLFFRGVLQELRPFWVVGLLASLWSALVYFPLLDVGRFPAVGLVIGTALVMMNMVYSYVRQRNGLAAAWLCQIVLNMLLLFIPFLAG